MNKVYSFLFSLLFISQFCFGQKVKEGIVTCEIKYSDAPPEGVSSVAPTAMTIYFKGGKSRCEYNNDARWVTIIDTVKKEILTMGTPDHKTAVRMTFNEQTENQKIEFDSVVIEPTNKTKDILGYKCTLVIVHYKYGPELRSMEIWYTKEIAATYPEFIFRQIDGFIMEYTHPSVSDPAAYETMTCTKVETVKVSDDKFVLPADCKVSNWSDINGNYKIEMH